ncbi:MAG: 16S rRNA (adenine(1518)-N(6)/adenine(1519)-N(6))-dimethyltransferase RsmA [Caldimicrobium sp.]|nr:16S rRNA (adenine(1518)-N(6)/adenine(1519)-N(6))-dimethyltransferase RsmA [Caldimicrobium sp.]MCX7612865.1 16S rRNA (adenine(1518)-N(6)/adenine(1519)-N(6))-dimethyltransferase RsmA [Caldimicrobium sp.]MDW8183607.1 16S rRNA (adenine(1518)-N(6)/adenine(1519)-N(6))-dimethyltransferase RsmA [Caldimicrobium sp.]
MRPRLKKSLGQHLLISPGILAQIAKLAEIKEDDVLLEIGPGTGNLTREILKYPFKKIYLLEFDTDMIAHLRETLQDARAVIIQADATDFDYSQLHEERIKVLGNLPYNVASLIAENVIYHHRLIPLALFLVQKEVAEKWLSGKSWLSLFIWTFYDIKYLMSIPPRFFLPPPKVTSSLLRLTLNPKTSIVDMDLYKGFLTHLYQQKRKMLKKKFPNTLLKEAGIRGEQRAEGLAIDEVLRFYHLWCQLHRGTPCY